METLTPELFDRWWNVHIHPEDQDEFVHGPWQGTQDHARFVCAYHVLNQTSSPRYIVTLAYCLALNLDPSKSALQVTHLSAQAMYAEPAVQFLLDRLQYRSSMAQEARITEVTLQKLEELHKRTRKVIGGERDGGTEYPFESYGDQLKTEAIALDAGLRYVIGRTKARADELKRAERKQLRESIERGRKEMKNVTSEPTKEEIKQFVLMAKQMLSPTEFKELVGDPALGGGDDGATNRS